MKRLKSYFGGIFTGFWIGAVFIATVFMSCKNVRDGWNVVAGDKKSLFEPEFQGGRACNKGSYLFHAKSTRPFMETRR